jgi:hypothetical protein
MTGYFDPLDRHQNISKTFDTMAASEASPVPVDYSSAFFKNALKVHAMFPSAHNPSINNFYVSSHVPTGGYQVEVGEPEGQRVPHWHARSMALSGYFQRF